MRSRNEHKDSLDGASYRELHLLSEVQNRPETSQRDLARRLGIALGMTNLLLHNLAQKGYVRITRAGWRRWLYALTPRGLSRKIHLTVAYIQRFLDHYQKARQTLRGELELVSLNAESRVAIYGTGEFAELVYLGLKELGIDEIDVFAPGNPDGSRFLGMPVREVTAFQKEQYDRVVVAYLGDAEARSGELLGLGVPPEKLVTFFTELKTPLVK